MALRRFLLILTAALVIILAVTAWFFPSNEDFRTENPSWNGIRDFTVSYPALPLPSLAGLARLSAGATLILVPYSDFTASELVQISGFVTRGGRLILADDYGSGNRILEYLGLKARFSGEALLDPMLNYKNREFPRITRFEPGPLTNDVESLVLNHATCLINVSAADTLAFSSSFSFLDLDNDGVWEEAEPVGALPVISHHILGNGQVILISDPSLFINGMANIAGNTTFIGNIAATSGSLYLDQSHLPTSELHQTKDFLAQAHSILSTAPATIGLAVLALTVVLKPFWRQKKKAA